MRPSHDRPKTPSYAPRASQLIDESTLVIRCPYVDPLAPQPIPSKLDGCLDATPSRSPCLTVSSCARLEQKTAKLRSCTSDRSARGRRPAQAAKSGFPMRCAEAHAACRVMTPTGGCNTHGEEGMSDLGIPPERIRNSALGSARLRAMIMSHRVVEKKAG